MRAKSPNASRGAGLRGIFTQLTGGVSGSRKAEGERRKETPKENHINRANVVNRTGSSTWRERLHYRV